MPIKVFVPGTRFWNKHTEKFLYSKDTTLLLEHSLLSISKWEQKWHEAFLGNKEKTSEQWLDYIKCMTIAQNVDPLVYSALTEENLRKIFEYIKDPMTATTIKERPGKRQQRVITNELIYCWMTQFGIPFECEKWHLNRLMTLIRVCSEEANPRKMSKGDIYKNNHALNAARKARLHTHG